MRVHSVIVKFVMMFVIASVLAACGAAVQKDKAGINDPSAFADDWKPTAEDLTGVPGPVFGTWAGNCTYTSSSGALSSTCNMSVEWQNTGSILTGQARVTSDGLTHVIDLKSYSINGNELRNISNGQVAGNIGAMGVQIYDSTFAEASGKIEGGQLGFRMRTVPNARMLSYSLVGKLQKQ
jgi:hypothetical protein